MEQVTTVGIDLAKKVFALHGVDGAGRVVLRRTVKREELVELVAGLSPCLIGMEAGSGAHDWARRFQLLGHEVRLMAAKFVAPYRRNGKNDGNDAEAICEAVTRPGMRFVPIKSAEQQAILTVHRVRQGFVEERTATINRIRGLLTEFGVVLSLRAFRSGRQFAAWLGLTPKQNSSGGRSRLGSITKRGDAYLRTLLVLGARSVLHTAMRHKDRISRWVLALQTRRGYHRALVAIANKNARIAWALLSRNQELRAA